MKYKGFEIIPVYHAGSDFNVKNGVVKACKPKSADIAYYDIIDPIENNKKHCAEFTIKECKKTIDGLLKLLGMVDNTQKSWDKLEGSK